ncbi:MAG: 50S ribosomal protein L24 [Gammaproteobacteria bacterium]
MNRIRKGDDVIVTAGKDRGRRGTVLRVLSNDKLIVENVNLVKKHLKPNPNRGQTGGIIDKEMPIERSNVMLYNAASGKGERIGVKTLEDGRKVRYFKSDNEVVDV